MLGSRLAPPSGGGHRWPAVPPDPCGRVVAALGARSSVRLANTLLPLASAVLIIDGVVGFGYHIRGILKRPGGEKKPLYNILYGPPIFAPMLMAACGLIGALAYFMRRERH